MLPDSCANEQLLGLGASNKENKTLKDLSCSVQGVLCWARWPLLLRGLMGPPGGLEARLADLLGHGQAALWQLR